MCIHIKIQKNQQKNYQSKYESATELRGVITIYENHPTRDHQRL